MNEKKGFFQNGGRVKLLVWLLAGCVGFLIRTGWNAGKYDSRLLRAESTILEHSEILKIIPDIKTSLVEIKTDLKWLKRNREG